VGWFVVHTYIVHTSQALALTATVTVPQRHTVPATVVLSRTHFSGSKTTSATDQSPDPISCHAGDVCRYIDLISPVWWSTSMQGLVGIRITLQMAFTQCHDNGTIPSTYLRARHSSGWFLAISPTTSSSALRPPPPPVSPTLSPKVAVLMLSLPAHWCVTTRHLRPPHSNHPPTFPMTFNSGFQASPCDAGDGCLLLYTWQQ